jgi:hypothetical protein
VLLWLLMLGQAAFAGTPAKCDVSRAPAHGLQTKTATQVQSGSGDRAAGLGTGWILRWRKYHHAAHKIAPANDPSDDETSDDPNGDEDDEDDLDGYIDSNVPNFAWLPEIVPYLSAPESAPGNRLNPPPASRPYLLLQRLRC